MKNTTTVIKSFNYRRLNDLKLHLQTELHEVLQVNDPNIVCHKIIHAFSSGIDKFSYLHKPNRKNTPIKPWITPGILASINRKNELFILKNNRATQSSTCDYRNYRNILVSVIRESKKMYIQNELRNATPKKTWEILNDLSKGSTQNKTLPDTFKSNSGLVRTPEDIANKFNSFFAGIGK